MSHDLTAIPGALRTQALKALCREFGVERLEVFGSAGTPAFEPGRSDYDLIVRLADDPSRSLGQRFVGLADALEALLGAKVDLISDHPIANPYLRASVESTRRVVYDESSAQASV